METETIISLVVGLVGALGLKEGWNIWKKKIDNSTQIKSEIREDNKQRIKELEDQVNELRERIEELLIKKADMKANVARLEERILLTAKNRVKNKTLMSNDGSLIFKPLSIETFKTKYYDSVLLEKHVMV